MSETKETGEGRIDQIPRRSNLSLRGPYQGGVGEVEDKVEGQEKGEGEGGGG